MRDRTLGWAAAVLVALSLAAPVGQPAAEEKGPPDRGGAPAAAVSGSAPTAPPEAPTQETSPEAATVAQFEPMLQGASDRERLNAVKALGTLAAKGNSAALEVLLKLLNDREAGTHRAFAAIGLRNAKRPETVAPLSSIVENRSLDPLIRQHAALTLGYIGERRAIPVLRRAMDDPNPQVRFYAAVALMQQPLAAEVPQWELQLKILKDREQGQYRRARAARALAFMDGDRETLAPLVVAPLVELLIAEPRSPEIETGRVLKKADGSQEMKPDESAVFAGIMNKDRNVRAKIALALGNLVDADAVRPLLRTMAKAQDDRIFFEAGVTALEKIEKRVGLTPFVGALKDPDPETRRQAVIFLEKVGSPEAAEALKGALKDGHAGVREQAARALAALKERGGAADQPAAEDSHETK